MRGFFCLGGTQIPRVLPTFDAWTGSHLTSRFSGKFSYPNLEYTTEVAIPQRDKLLEVTTNLGSTNFDKRLASIDTDDEGPYRERIKRLQIEQVSSFMGIVNTLGEHGSLTVMSNSPLYIWGLLHNTGTAYLLWSNNPNYLDQVRAEAPLQFLIYRFAVTDMSTLYLHSQRITYRWFTWCKKQDPFFAFNALEKSIHAS